MGILLFELFRNPLFMGILNKWETLVILAGSKESTSSTSTTTMPTRSRSSRRWTILPCCAEEWEGN